MNRLSKENISQIAQAVIDVEESKIMKSINISENNWFNIFKNPESKVDNEVDVVLMNGCASTPFMFFADASDKDLEHSIEMNATRILEEYNAELVLDRDEPDLEY